jgi:hypothetical protein
MTANTAQVQPGPWVQLPDMTVGMNRYLEFLQRQIELTGELTAIWVSTMNTVSDIVLANGPVARSRATERTLGGPAGHHPMIGARTPQRSTHSAADPDDRPPGWQELRAAEVFDEVMELLVDDDIVAAVSEQATSK